MLKLRTSIVAIGVLCGVLGLTVAFAPLAGAQDQGSARETAANLLEDGLDALADHAADSGRRLLDRVISDYPGSTEALTARRALAALDRGDSGPGNGAAIQADQAERSVEYRRAFLVDVGDRVFFAENSAALGGRARSIIRNQAHWLSVRPDLTVVVIGRADDEGDRNAARDLSLQRAQAVRDRLLAGGLSPNRIETRPAGNQDPVALCGGPLCEAQNRNAEVFINDWRLSGGWQSSQQTPGSSRKPPIGLMAHPQLGPTDQVSQ